MARLANISAIAPLTASRGNSSVRPVADTPTVYRPAAEYAKVATKVLSAIWVGRSRRKVCSSRGENCVDDSCSATTVRPSTNAITVTTVPVTLLSSVRASSAVPWNANGEPGPIRMRDRMNPTTNASTALRPGSTHRDPLAYSRIALSIPHLGPSNQAYAVRSQAGRTIPLPPGWRTGWSRFPSNYFPAAQQRA
jgi:hypothetical protein